jgi:hypothetical protein
MKKKVVLIGTVVALALSATVYGFIPSKRNDCPLAGTKECPLYQNCPLKGTADCPFIKNCPKKETADCPYTNGAASCCAKK